MTPFETFLGELAKVLQFSHLAPDGKGACLIVMKEGDIPLLFEYDEQLVPRTVLVSCLVCPVPVDRRTESYEASLVANQNSLYTLSVKPDEEFFYLHYRFHPAIQAADLDLLIKGFLEQVKHWKQAVDAIVKAPPRHALPHPSSIQVFPYKA